MSSDGDVIRCVAPWPGTAARLLEGFASLGTGLWHIEQICAASGTGIRPGDAAQVLAALSATSVCVTGETEDTWRSQLSTVELVRLAQMLKGADHYRRLRADPSSLELAVTMPLPPSRLEQELSTIAGRPGGYLTTAAAFSRIAQAANRRLVVLTPFIDAGGFLWLRRTFETAASQVEKTLILREADKYGSRPSRWCKSGGHGLSSMMARAARQAAGMRRGRACGSSLNWASFSRLM
jgi:hypothetical protein